WRPRGTTSAARTRRSRTRRGRASCTATGCGRAPPRSGLGGRGSGPLRGVHVQNLDQWEPYAAAVKKGEIPWNRAYRPTHEERMIRELVLQLKRGSSRPAYFRDKYAVDVAERFKDPLASLAREGYLAESGPERVAFTREGLLRADVLLRRFFLPQHA